MTSRLATLFAIVSMTCSPSAVLALQISFDYRFDSAGFFTQSRRDLLQQAGDAIAGRLSDTLLPIVPGGGNTYVARFVNPANDTTASITDLNIAGDTLLVFAAAYNQGGSTLGSGGPGWYGSLSGSGGFQDAVMARGQMGALGTVASRTDFGPWGGSVSFNSGNSNWYFDPDPSTTESFSGDDFYSVALHEIGHVLGYGTAASWDNLNNGGNFTGAHAQSVFGGPVPLEPGSRPAHWASGTGALFDGLFQEAAMDPSLTVGSRKRFTDLDLAGLQDIGWQVSSIPLPTPLLLLASALGLLLGLRRQQS